MVTNRWIAGVILALGISANGAVAHDEGGAAKSDDFTLDQVFSPGLHEFSAGTGIMWSPIGSTIARPTVNYVVGYMQVGYMLNELWMSGFWRNNYEIVLEGFGAGIYQNTGTYIAGTTLWLRHNLVPEGWRVTPFAEIGLGFVSMDIDHRYDGHNFNFNLDAAGGFRYFIKPKLSLNAEFKYQHISNANTGSHNVGINAIGPLLSVSWLF